ncbi:hypothetical protein OG735_27000 [Streptomyces sp. NBC_01210]|uniref:hypothetical protein n=1 Tax=Streptomyces sp. NBC_01210 TaxID=2903774 RepID=UPI002E12545C|nr:hypothetical protein OG735_27000 [Streptomyces sp. NBC_01210]
MEQIGPRRVLVTLVALGAGVFLLGTGLMRLETRLTGVAGQFRAERCEISKSRHGDDGLLCSGSFEAEDGAFRIAQIEVETAFDEKPTEPVTATVDGPSATVAVEHRLGAWLAPGATGLFCLLVAAWNVRSALRRRRGAGSPTASDTAEAGRSQQSPA